MSGKLMVVIVLLLLLIIFILQNYEVVKIQFLFWSVQTSRALILFVTLLVGIVVGWSIAYIKKE
ncbi:LapA family protein [Candidatus Omnitrophota bacterium]